MKIQVTHRVSKCHNHAYFCFDVRVEILPSIHHATGVMVGINTFLMIHVDVHIPELLVIPQNYLVTEFYTTYYLDIQFALNSIPLNMLHYATFLFTILSKKNQNHHPDFFLI